MNLTSPTGTKCGTQINSAAGLAGLALHLLRIGKALAALLALTIGTLSTTQNAVAQTTCSITPNMLPVRMDLSTHLTSGINVLGNTASYHTSTPGSPFTVINCTPALDPATGWFANLLTNVGISSGFPIVGREGPWTYYKVDEYFSIAFSWSDCSGTWYLPVVGFQSGCGFQMSTYPGSQYFRNPTTWTVRLRVERAFSGPRAVNLPNVFRYYYGDVMNDSSTLQVISLNGYITVPETCTINSGQMIQVNFGNIGSGRFESKGQKPSGYTPVITEAPVTCNDAAAQRNVNVSLAATPSPDLNTAIRTSNPDVGIVVTDINDRTVRPNVDKLPLNLTSTGSGRNDGKVIMKAFPVSTTGRPPSRGDFSATAAITVTFD